ncbi:hypothetical protein D3C77_548280 [compost metagenome]
MTEGAVKALLHRARMKLRSMQRESNDGFQKGNRDSRNTALIDEQIVYAYLKAFREHNPGALLMLMNESSSLEQTLPPVLQESKQHNHRHYERRTKAIDYTQALALAAA